MSQLDDILEVLPPANAKITKQQIKDLFFGIIINVQKQMTQAEEFTIQSVTDELKRQVEEL